MTKSIKKNKPTVISLFAGAGGMDLGFKKAGFDIVWANDFDPDSVKTYKKNIGDHIVLGDITKPSVHKTIPKIKPDVVIGGFPCQGFSIANAGRSEKDERNFLYKEMIKVIKKLQPKYFVAENVKGILSLGKGKVIELIVKDFKKIGYNVDYKLLNAANYGVPQMRERVFIIGNRIKKSNPYPVPTHRDHNPINGKKVKLPDLFEKDKSGDLKNWVTTESVIFDLKDVDISYDPIKKGNKIIYNHMADTNVHDEFWGRKYPVNQFDICDYLKMWRKKAGISVKKIDQIFGYRHTAGHWFRKDNNSGSIPNPSDWKRLKKILKFDNKYDKQVTTLVKKKIKFEQSLRIQNWNRASDTITATSPEIHPNLKRRMSVRECATIQTFPENFIFEGSTHRSMIKQIGNAVPVSLAELIAKKIKQNLL